MYRTLDTMTEEQARKSGVPVRITYRIGWRRSYTWSDVRCDQTKVEMGTILNEGRAELVCQQGCSGSIADMSFRCTDYSEQENWSFGENDNDVTLPYPEDGLVQASYSEGDWVALEHGGGGKEWELRLTVNMTKTLKLRGSNASPISKMAPIVRLQQGCNHTVQIPVEDADGDVVHCRWAEGERGECAGVCQALPGAVLDKRSCQLHYSATGSAGYYAVALQVEDFTDNVDSEPFSSVPLQFLVLVYAAPDVPCESRPEFVAPTRPDKSCVGVAPNGTFSEVIMAKTGSSDLTIVDISTQSPPGLIKSELEPFSEKHWYVNMTWTPGAEQQGPNLFCYLARDSSDQSTDQLCITILGAVAPPSVHTSSPSGRILPTHSQWSVTFDRDIFRPTRSSYIRVHDYRGTEVFKIDAATSAAVQYSTPGQYNYIPNRPVSDSSQVLSFSTHRDRI